MHPTLGEESVVLGGGEAVRHTYLVTDNFDRTVQAGQAFLGHYLTVGHLGHAGRKPMDTCSLRQILLEMQSKRGERITITRLDPRQAARGSDFAANCGR